MTPLNKLASIKKNVVCTAYYAEAVQQGFAHKCAVMGLHCNFKPEASTSNAKNLYTNRYIEGVRDDCWTRETITGAAAKCVIAGIDIEKGARMVQCFEKNFYSAGQAPGIM
eukprot:1150840-Pelagomonas_calceolata.AAC.5